MALTDLDAATSCGCAGSTRQPAAILSYMRQPDRDVEAWSLSSGCADAGDGRERSRLRRAARWTVDGERPIVTGLPRGVVNDLAWSPDSTRPGIQRRRADRTAVALALA